MRRTPFSHLLLALLLGPVAGALGLAVGHLVAAATRPAASPVLAVGSTVIDLTPTPVKEWAVAHFGTADKPILIGSVLVVVLLVAAVAGLLGRRRLWLGSAVLVALAAAAVALALTRPGAGAIDALPGVVTGAVAVAALIGLVRLMPGSAANQAHSDAAPATTAVPAQSRRGVVIGLGAVTAAATLTGGGAQALVSYRRRPQRIALPAAADPAPPLPAGIERMVRGVTPFRTQARDLYRVDTRLDVPVIDADRWRLRIDGDVERPYSLSLDDLLAMPLVERDITLTCVSNSVGGQYAGGARWLGVRLTDLLERAGVGRRADQILSTDVSGMTISTPLDLATDGRDALLAVGMNGEQLPREHGFPARLVIPGLYGFISATKWVTRLTLTTYAEREAYWTKRDWATDAPIKPTSRIDTPRPLAELKSGEIVVGGIAWAQADGGVQAVEVSVDGGPWRPAQLGPAANAAYWRQWYFRWDARDAARGTHTLSCRAVDGQDQTQTTKRATPFPDGASGLHTIQVSVG